MQMLHAEPFTIDVPDAMLDDRRSRIAGSGA